TQPELRRTIRSALLEDLPERRLQFHGFLKHFDLRTDPEIRSRVLADLASTDDRVLFSVVDALSGTAWHLDPEIAKKIEEASQDKMPVKNGGMRYEISNSARALIEESGPIPQNDFPRSYVQYALKKG